MQLLGNQVGFLHHFPVDSNAEEFVFVARDCLDQFCNLSTDIISNMSQMLIALLHLGLDTLGLLCRSSLLPSYFVNLGSFLSSLSFFFFSFLKTYIMEIDC